MGVNTKSDQRARRKGRIRKRVKGTQERPRLSVFRSARHIYAQIIDDTCGCTLVCASVTGQLTRMVPRGSVCTWAATWAAAWAASPRVATIGDHTFFRVQRLTPPKVAAPVPTVNVAALPASTQRMAP